jgi:signal transduction histidine kinase
MLSLVKNCLMMLPLCDQVQDTGVGLNPQDIPNLFNKFLQADSTTTRNYSGTGLSLAICKGTI